MQWVYHRSEFSRNKLKESVLHTAIVRAAWASASALSITSSCQLTSASAWPAGLVFYAGPRPLTDDTKKTGMKSVRSHSLLTAESLRAAQEHLSPPSSSDLQLSEVYGNLWFSAECAVVICLFCFYFGGQVQMWCREDLNTGGLSLAYLKVQRIKSKLQLHVLNKRQLWNMIERKYHRKKQL